MRFNRLPALSERFLSRLQIENALARGQKARIRIFRELLRRQRTELRSIVSPPGNLPRGKPMRIR
jgi:hypothetical protein